MERLQTEHAQEKETNQTEKAEEERKIMESEKQLRRVDGGRVEKEIKIVENEKEMKRVEGVQTEELRNQAMQRILLNDGNYVADRCLTYKSSAQWDRKCSARYWSEIHEIIESEKQIEATSRSLLQAPPPLPMLGHLLGAALDLKVPVDDIMWNISMYS
ncbi:hypothetical protein H4I95_02677 [Botrytis cinerea]